MILFVGKDTTLFRSSSIRYRGWLYSRFIAARLFGEPFRVVKVDKSAVEYCARLTEFYAQFRAVAVNYNQVVKALNSNFSEKKALAFLYKLEKATTELSMLNRQVIDLTNECKELWLPK